MTSFPDVLFSNENQVIVEGSVVWLYCRVNSVSSFLIVNWMRSNDLLVQDVPHIRIRRSNEDSFSTVLLVVDNFTDLDNGIYQCIVQDGRSTYRGRSLTLMGN